MKQPRRWWRLLVAGLLLVLAWQLHARWPIYSLRVPRDGQLLGFDTARQLVYAVEPDEQHVLKSYDLRAGKLVSSIVIEPKATQLQPHDNALYSQTDVAEAWRWALSPNMKEVIGINSYHNQVLRMDLATGKLLQMKPNHNVSNAFPIGSYGFDELGLVLALLTDNHIAVQLIDWTESPPLFRKKMAEVPENGMRLYYRYLERHLVSVDSSYQHLAVNARDGLRLYEVATGKIGLQYPAQCRSRFLDNGRVLLAVPQWEESSPIRPLWYERNEQGDWTMRDNSFCTPLKDEWFVDFTSNHLVTQRSTFTEITRPSWFSREWWDSLLPFTKLTGSHHTLRFRDIHTGKLVREVNFFEPISEATLRSSLRSIDASMVSEDSNWLAYESESELVVCHVNGRRTLWYWVTVVSISLAALWNLWRFRVTTSTRLQPTGDGRPPQPLLH